MTQAVQLASYGSTGQSLVFKNRIINGAMVIDQRNAGASITPTDGQYSVDRFQAAMAQASKYSVQQNAGSVTPPAGFSNYLGVTSLSAYSVGSGDYFFLRQYIEGFNFADMAFGTANASAITLSFRVYSSLTGTFGGAVKNSTANRSYPFSYTISSANTWTTISVTIPGDTTGTWIGATNGTGIAVLFNLGSGSTYSGTAGAWASANYIGATGNVSVVGTNGATFYITGVQLEKGSTATSFDYRSQGTELALCQRYFFSSYNYGTVAGSSSQDTNAIYGIGVPNQFFGGMSFPSTMRTAPTVTGFHPSTGASGQIGNYADGNTVYTISGSRQSDKGFTNFVSSSSISGGTGLRVMITATAEL